MANSAAGTSGLDHTAQGFETRCEAIRISETQRKSLSCLEHSADWTERRAEIVMHEKPCGVLCLFVYP